MRFARTFVLEFFSLLAVFPALAQQASTPVQRDPKAVAILQQSLLAMGGASSPRIADFQIEGTISAFDTPTQAIGTFLAKSRGFDLSVVVNVGNDTSNLRVLRGIGSSTSNGVQKPLPLHTTTGLQVDLIPIFYRWTEFVNANAAIRYLGETRLEGKNCYLIEVESPPDSNPQRRNDLGKNDVLIDETTSLVSAIRYSASDGFFSSTRLPKETRYSSYKTVDGILVPMTIVKYVDQRALRILNFTSVRFNNGFSDADFRN